MEDLSTLNLVANFGKTSYLESMAIMDGSVEAVRKNRVKNILLFFKYDPVFTVGRGKKEENYKGVEIIETDRGGDVTYHGPGQIIGYPIIDLRNSLNVRGFVKNVESIIIDSLNKFGYKGHVGDEPGIWVDGKKVASLGMAIRNGISAHGFSINTSSEVFQGFKKIRACGLDPDVIGFIEIDENTLIDEIVKNFSKFYGEFQWISAQSLLNVL